MMKIIDFIFPYESKMNIEFNDVIGIGKVRARVQTKD